MSRLTSIRPAASAGSAAAKCRSASSPALSTNVPEGSMNLSDDRVLYEFCVVPQHMPLELLAMTPPIVQADALAGSGPRR
jgi:hypothetical protein